MQERAQELAASVSTEKDVQLQQVMQQVTSLEAALALKEEVSGSYRAGVGHGPNRALVLLSDAVGRFGPSFADLV